MTKKLASLLIVLLPLAWTVPGCVGTKKPKQDEPASAALVVDSLPAGISKLNSNFGDKVTLVGYELENKGKVKPGSTVSYKLFWKRDKALDGAGWKLFTHVLDSKNKRVLNIDKVGKLRADSAPGPTAWKEGKFYVDEQSFKVPKEASGDKLSVVVGLWSRDKRLDLKSGPSAGDNRAVAFKVNVTGAKAKQKKKNTRVPELRIDRAEKNLVIAIDGKLDEDVWKTAPSTGPFVNVRTGKVDPAAAVQGEAKLLWDETSLYVGFTVQDKDIVGGFDKTAKDPHLWEKDCVELMIDPDGDGDNKDYYEIQIGPQNLVFDSRFDSYNKPRGGEKGPFGHQDWTANLQSAVTIDGTLDKPGDDDKGYVVELKIPWKSFDKAGKTPPAVGKEWRVNLYAMQNNGGVGWSPILGQGNFHKASRFGRVLWAEKGWTQPGKKDVAAKVTPEQLKEGLGAKVGAPATEPAKVRGEPAVLPKSPAPSLGQLTPPAPKPSPPAAPKPAAPKPAAPAAPKPAPPTP
jgi:hypothetical protein